MTEPQPAERDEVEVAHEALIRHWPRLRAWLDQDRVALLLRESVREAAQEWERHNRDESYLAHRGRRLAEAEALAHHPRFTLNAQERAYLDASIALREREEQEREAQQQRELDAQRERAELAEVARHEAEQRVVEQAVAARGLRRRLMIAVGLGALALLAAVGAFYGFRQAGEQQAEAEQRGVAEVQRVAAVAAAGTAEAESTRADAARAEAERERGRADDQAGTAEAEQAVAVAAAATAEAERDRADEQARISLIQALAAQAMSQMELGEHERGALLARQAYLFDEASGGPVRERVDAALRAVLDVSYFSHSLRTGTILINSVAFGPDGQRLASGGSDLTVRVWDLTHPEAAPTILEGHERSVYAVASAPDGRALATGGGDKAVRLWDLDHPEAVPVVLKGHEGSVNAVAFSPDGKRLASGGLDQTVRLWLVGTLDELVCTRVWRNLTLDEWHQFVGEDVPYDRTCRDLPSGESLPPSTPGTPTPVAVVGSTQDMPLDHIQEQVQALEDLLDGLVLPAPSSPLTDAPNPTPVEPAATPVLAGAETSLAVWPPLPTPSVAIWSQEP